MVHSVLRGNFSKQWMEFNPGMYLSFDLKRVLDFIYNSVLGYYPSSNEVRAWRLGSEYHQHSRRSVRWHSFRKCIVNVAVLRQWGGTGGKSTMTIFFRQRRTTNWATLRLSCIQTSRLICQVLGLSFEVILTVLPHSQVFITIKEYMNFILMYACWALYVIKYT